MQHLQLKAFVHAADPDTLRIYNGDGGWFARSGEVTLQRPDGSTFFPDLTHLLGVLASVGIRCCVIEWGGLEPQLDAGGPAAFGGSDTFKEVIARSKRILQLVDDYAAVQSSSNRTALRRALFDEFHAAAVRDLSVPAPESQ